MHLFEDLDDVKLSGKPFSDDEHDDSMDELLLLASQAYESRYAFETKAGSRNLHSEGVNMSTVQLEEHPIGVLNSPSSHSSAVRKEVSVKETSSCSVSEVKNRTEFSSKASDTSSANTTRFASPKSSRYVDQIRKSAIPKKNQAKHRMG